MSQDSDTSKKPEILPTLLDASPSSTADSHSPSDQPSSETGTQHPESEVVNRVVTADWKSRFTTLTEKVRTGFTSLQNRRTSNGEEDSQALTATLKNIDLHDIANWITKLVRTGGLNTAGTATAILLCSWFLSDISSVYLERFIPEPPPARLARTQLQSNFDRSGGDPVQVIMSRNLFSSQGLVPGEETSGGAVDPGGAPVKTTLPFSLIGTLILSDEFRSIATIEDKGASQVYPVRIEDEIPGKAKIISIESRKVVFLNLSSSRREFVELPLDNVLGNSRITLGGAAKVSGSPTVESVGNNQFNVARAAVDTALADLPKVLTQARAVPNIENGIANGYKLFQIVPGSIYQTIGLQNGDTLLALDGSPMNDPGKAFELLNQLKTASRMELTVKRNGKVQNFTYEIR